MARGRQEETAESSSRDDDAPPDDEAAGRLSPTERAKLAMDSWEPSLLRYLLGIEDERDRDPNG